MTPNLLFQVQRGQLQTLDEILTTWQKDNRDGVSARDAELIVRTLLDAPERLRAVWQRGWDDAVAGKLDDFIAAGETIRQLFADTEKTLERVAAWARQVAQTTGRAVRDLEKLDETIVALRQERQE